MTRAKPRRNGAQRPRVATKPANAAPATCGDFGGVGAGGALCTHEAGWGTGRGTGRCKEHDEVAAETVKALKKTFLEQFSTGKVSMQEAASQAGTSPVTIWRLRQADEAFDKAVLTAQAECDTVRVGLVEDSLLAQILSGKAPPVLTIFFLKNRAPHRWRDVQEHRVGGPNGGAIPLTVLRDVLSDALPPAVVERANAANGKKRGNGASR